MIIKNLTIDNFKCFYNNKKTFNFETSNTINDLHIIVDDNIIFINGKNGVGKTTVLDAIYFLFTNKLWNGLSLGYQPLTKDNQYIDVKPFIELVIENNNSAINIKLDNGHRYINNIKFKNLNDFKTTLSNLQINVDKLLYSMNPLYILQYLTPKEGRELFSSIIINDELKLEVTNSFMNNDFVKNFDQNIISFIAEQIKIMSVSTLLNSLTNDKRKTLQNIEFVNKQQENAAKMFTWNETLEEELKELIVKRTQKQNIDTQLSVKKNVLVNNQNKVCFNCKQEIKSSLTPNQIKELEKEITGLENESKQYQYDENRINELQNNKNNFEKFSNINLQEWEELQLQLEDLNNKELLTKKYQKIMIEVIDQKIKKELPFELKLFHLSKDDVYSETFTILKNGVDYKYLNTSQKLMVGINLINFLNKDQNIPLLIDFGESIDQNNLQLILSNCKQQVLVTNVKG